MQQLYPLKFDPILVEKVWGGRRLEKLNKKLPDGKPIGESWELSAVADRVSVVKNGFLAGNTIEELVEIYMGDLVGDRIYLKYGVEFPLLFKFIDANDKLSIQVHPDNDVARFRHYAYGKTELWYVLDAEPDAELIVGFKKPLRKSEFIDKVENQTFIEYLNFEKVQRGDVLFIPPGRVHALLKGIMVAEIQQTSDITYRIYDWGRVGLDGKPRGLHVDLAVDVIDFSVKSNYKTQYQRNPDVRNIINENPFFTTNYITFDKEISLNYDKLDSFVVYMCVSGKFDIVYNGQKYPVSTGETVLIPAEAEGVLLSGKAEILETYIPFVFLDEDAESLDNN